MGVSDRARTVGASGTLSEMGPWVEQLHCLTDTVPCWCPLPQGHSRPERRPIMLCVCWALGLGLARYAGKYQRWSHPYFTPIFSVFALNCSESATGVWQRKYNVWAQSVVSVSHKSCPDPYFLPHPYLPLYLVFIAAPTCSALHAFTSTQGLFYPWIWLPAQPCQPLSNPSLSLQWNPQSFKLFPSILWAALLFLCPHLLFFGLFIML